jgi:AcrR family transcriptional regulator
MTKPRNRLTRERVLRAAIAFADKHGIESLSMRKLGEQLGVEAMSLYNHVSNKTDLVDGIVEMVVGEFVVPSTEAHWKAALRETAKSAHRVLLRHPWAPALIESRATPSTVRFLYAEAVIGTLRRAGFPVEMAYRAQLTIDSYVYGFTLHAINWPFAPEEQGDVAANLRQHIASNEYPYLTEMIEFIVQAPGREATRTEAPYESEFDFGLELILDGLARFLP